MEVNQQFEPLIAEALKKQVMKKVEYTIALKKNMLLKILIL
jgi:hypothetical protein